MATVRAHTDEGIQRDVLEALKRKRRVYANEVGVAVKDGIVTLTGCVDSHVEKSAAQDAAHCVRSVKAVVNDIEVRLPGSAERSDEDLAKAVIKALQWDAGISAGTLDVTVSQGRVTLQGEVEYSYQKKEAESALKYIAGIRGIRNLIATRSRNSQRKRPPGMNEFNNRITISPL